MILMAFFALEKYPCSAKYPCLAWIGIWYRNFWNFPSLAILPYAKELEYFPNYLQQLEMESNGKSINRNGEKLTYATAPVVFGQCGTDFQHSFTQLLCQGTEVVPCDFIAFAKSNYTNSHIEKKTTLERHTRLVSHFFAQQLALAFGTSFFETGKIIVPSNPKQFRNKQLCRI